jgi:hypothetical protein
MNFLKQIGLTIFELGKQICLLPQTITKALKQRQQQGVADSRESERLDRLRNPSKYQGK